MNGIFHLNSVAELHQLFGLEKPLHPLVTIIRKWPETDVDFSNLKMKGDLYVIGLKGNIRGKFKCGQNTYDYKEGSIAFLAPNHVTSCENSDPNDDIGAWNIFFHPDLIRKSEFAKTIKNYSFFDYDSNEALHISEKEKIMLGNLVNHIELELENSVDKHSQNLILANIDTLLKYCQRYYERQFYTRSNQSKDTISRFETYMKEYFTSDKLKKNGLPTISSCGETTNMSGGYLSDLLCLETGSSAKDHIHKYIINAAKKLLISSNNPVNQMAYSLGFEYPQHFSKLFKTKIGISPNEYRNLN